MAAVPAIAATSSLTVFAIGAAANIAASFNNNHTLAAKTWSPSGGFIGLTKGSSPGTSASLESPSTHATPVSTGGVPIGGASPLPAPPVPFGRFRKCKPTKLPGPPKSFDPATSP